MVWMESLPSWVLLLGWLAVALGVALLARLAVRTLVPDDERGDVHGVVGPLMPGLGAAFAVLMAITLASEAGYLKSAQDLVGAEAASASRLAWAAAGPAVDTEPIHVAMADYLRATRQYEWEGDVDRAEAKTASAIATLERVVRTEAARSELGTPQSTELLTSLDALTSQRRARLAASSRHLPTLYVVTLVASGLALLANAGALVAGVGRRSSLLVVGLAVVVGLSLALLFSLSAPWRGPLIASGEPIDHIVADLQAGFFTL